jgi:enolase
MIIKNIKTREILDSRGAWTIELKLTSNNKDWVSVSIPSGKSKGKDEAASFDASKSLFLAKKIFLKIKNKQFKNQKDFDNFLIKLDGTSNKSNLGGNNTLAFSYGFLKLTAKNLNKEIWKCFNELLKISKPQMPKLFVNVINGGSHANNNLDFQEYLIIPKTKNIKEAVDLVLNFYFKLGEKIKSLKSNIPLGIGDEGGYASNFKNNLEPFEIMDKLMKKFKIRNKFDFGLDAAASSIKSSNQELFNFYKTLYQKFNIHYIEDPFKETDFVSFSKLKNALKNVLICGDDLTVTNVKKIKEAHQMNSINAVIIKPNQIGTVLETIEAIKLAKNYNFKIIVSHRSGETNDDIIADLAYGVGAYGFKLGAPQRGERISKYNRLLEIGLNR